MDSVAQIVAESRSHREPNSTSHTARRWSTYTRRSRRDRSMVTKVPKVSTNSMDRCLFCLHTLGSGALLQRGVSMKGFFKGVPVRWRWRPVMLPAMVVSFSGYLVTGLGAAVTIPQRQLPPHTMAFASTPKGICLHTSGHLPTQSKASAHALQCMCLKTFWYDLSSSVIDEFKTESQCKRSSADKASLDPYHFKNTFVQST